MTEREKLQKGLWYDANNDVELLNQRLEAEELCFELNHTRPKDINKKEEILKRLLPHRGIETTILTPFYTCLLYTSPPGQPQSQLDFTYFGGIYRDAWLDAVAPVHITDANYEDIVAGGGILVDYPTVSEELAEVSVQTHLRNETDSDVQATLQTEILDADGVVVASTENSFDLSAQGDFTEEQLLTVENPQLWNLETPYLHTLVSSVQVNGVEVDRVETKIGIRKIEMHKDYGLKINGEVQDALMGVNRHQE